MLFLSRKVGDSIVINKDIIITVTQVNSGRVKLSFSYPSGTQVLRKEVFDRIEQENKSAAQSVTVDIDFANSLQSLTQRLNEKG